jgi:hypothetical protein
MEAVSQPVVPLSVIRKTAPKIESRAAEVFIAVSRSTVGMLGGTAILMFTEGGFSCASFAADYVMFDKLEDFQAFLFA